MEKDKRNYGIDFLRVLSMIFVIILHCNLQGGLISNVPQNSIQYKFIWLLEIIAYPAVNIFALITGYVLYDKKNVKIKNYLNLWLEVAFYAFFVNLSFDIVNSNMVLPKDYLYSFIPVTSGQWWYFTAYSGLFIMIPFLNKAIANINKHNFKILFILIIIIFSFYDTISKAFNLNDGYSVIWLIVVYILGAAIKKCDIAKKIKSSNLILLMLILYFITYIYKIYGFEFNFLNLSINNNLLITYTSPTILGVAILYVIIFSRINFNEIWKMIIAFTSPSAFSIYILNNHVLIWNNIMCGLFTKISNKSTIYIFACILSFTFLFIIGSIIVDKIRIRIFKLLGIFEYTNNIQNKIYKLKEKHIKI